MKASTSAIGTAAEMNYCGLVLKRSSMVTGGKTAEASPISTSCAEGVISRELTMIITVLITWSKMWLNSLESKRKLRMRPNISKKELKLNGLTKKIVKEGRKRCNSST